VIISEEELVALASKHGEWTEPDTYNGFCIAVDYHESEAEIINGAERFRNWVMTLDNAGSYDELTEYSSESEAAAALARHVAASS